MDSFLLRKVLCWSFVMTVFSYQANNVQEMEIIDVGTHGDKGGLVYRPCNETAVPIYIKKLSLRPDTPIKLPSSLILNAELDVVAKITKPVEYDLDISVKINDGYEHICDLLRGYCQGDFCKLIEKEITTCPGIIAKMGFNCRCPILQNTYTLSNVPIILPSFQFAISGAFNITMQLKSDQDQLMCANIQFCLKNCDS